LKAVPPVMARCAMGRQRPLAAIAIAVRCARTAVFAGAAERAVDVEPVGQAGAAVAASKRIVRATGEACNEESGQ